MFYYYGRKKRIADLYPKPKYDAIVEPFAGSASYSMSGKNWQKDVHLFDIDMNIVRVWQYLLQANAQDIFSLPDLKPGDDLNDHKLLTPAEKALIGFHLNPGSSTPKYKVSKFNRWGPGKAYIASNLYKVKHWSITHLSYKMMVSEKAATWFVDPPYASGGEHYKFGRIDYDHLANWINTLKGQIMVCERSCAKWLPFEPLTNYSAIGDREVSEGIYIKETGHA